MLSGTRSPFSFRVTTSDHHAVQELICWFLQQPHKFGVSWDPRHLFAMSRRFAGKPPPLSTHPSGKYWGKPPALTPPGHKGKGKASGNVFSAPEESICDTIDHDRPQQFAGNFTRPLLLAEPRHDSGRAYWQGDVRRLVPFAIGQTC